MKSSLRILEIIASVDPRGGGAIEGLLRQAEARRAYGMDTHIVSLDGPDDPWVRECPVPTFAVGSGMLSRPSGPFNWLWTHYGYAPKFSPWLRAHAGDYDIAVVNGLWNHSSFGARQVLPRSCIPYVVFAHGMLDPWARGGLKHAMKQALWAFSEGPLLKNADAVLFTTEDEMIRARNTFWPYRVRERIVGYGTADIQGDCQQQISAFRGSLPALGDRPFLLFLGRIHPKKGCDLLVTAFSRIAAEHPELDLVIAGPDQIGWRGQLEAQARAAGIERRIHWPGAVFGDVKWGALRACDAFVLPSHQENFGVAVAETLAAGKPVLITDKVNIWREVKSDAAGLIATDDAAGVCDMLARFVSMPQSARTVMGAAARDCFLRRFEIGIPARQLGRLLSEIAMAHGRTIETAKAML
ncbi:glycosyltransferase [Bradyrhizobium arachidis]|uniref:glycosyltransferase n=1 Tax=Bradyrhizobium arachidis TaxID=858423 RepID=UPI0008E5A96A|nr:glycosyltransferase [Bradyrhizobium arachidis]SFV12231.1 Glycosyltransferase involved in cell wall bisynthesis [Bradyrhizobium arachidis]